VEKCYWWSVLDHLFIMRNRTRSTTQRNLKKRHTHKHQVKKIKND